MLFVLSLIASGGCGYFIAGFVIARINDDEEEAAHNARFTIMWAFLTVLTLLLFNSKAA